METCTKITPFVLGKDNDPTSFDGRENQLFLAVEIQHGAKTRTKIVEVDVEKIPSWAIIQKGALGSTDWKSQFNQWGGAWSAPDAQGRSWIEGADIDALLGHYQLPFCTATNLTSARGMKL